MNNQLGGGNRSSHRFAGISRGKIMIRCDKGTPEAKTFTNSKGEEYYALVYEEFTGYVKGIEFKPSNLKEDQTDIIITIDTHEDHLTKIQTKVGGGYWFNLSKMLPLADLSLPVTFSPSFKDEQASMFLSQGTTNLKCKYTKDNPGDLPQGEKLVAGKTVVWDFSAQNEYLQNELTNLSFYSTGAADKFAKSDVVEDQTETQESGDNDDLPF
jgi:hypothetical protein